MGSGQFRYPHFVLNYSLTCDSPRGIRLEAIAVEAILAILLSVAEGELFTGILITVVNVHLLL